VRRYLVTVTPGPETGRLARAIRTHQGVDLAFVDGQIDAAKDLFLTGADVKVSNL
jgi:hypothetical protein